MRRMLLLSLLSLFIWPFQVDAHTYLSESTPTDGEELTEPIQEIKLKFDTAIEQNGIIEIIDTDQQEIPVQVKTEGNTLIGTLEEELQNGAYEVKYSIVGADGHVMDGSLSFTSLAAEEVPKVVPEDTEEALQEPKQEAPLEEQTFNEEEDGGFLIPVLTIGLFVILAGMIFLLTKKKKD